MEGFGNTDIGSPFSYGSVKNGYSHNPSFEQRLKKQYWKTKQSVRQKLNKREDEFVVAGDANIDIKLEKARHLYTSCSKLIHVTKGCVFHTKSLSYYEQVLGNYLASCGELDFTLAGQIMTKTGGLHKNNAEIRLKQLPALLRVQAETTTFATSGLGDLAFSIDNLERTRKEYRAVLLWMKDVSEKLHNPDAKGQLVRFREAQAQVKISKESFEHIKGLLSEKIEMVSASRCNLLSNVLPIYQTAITEYLDQSANELFKVLTELRSQTQHQYKVNELSQEIRDLEINEDLHLHNDTALSNTPEIGEINTGDVPLPNMDTGDNPSPNIDTRDVPLPSMGTAQNNAKKEKKDHSLFGMLQREIVSNSAPLTNMTTPTNEITSTQPPTEPPPPNLEVDTKKTSSLETSSDATPTATPSLSNPPDTHLDDLLSLLDGPLESLQIEDNEKDVAGKGGVANKGGVVDEWDTFMTQQQSTDGEDNGWGELVGNDSQESGWSKSMLDSIMENEFDKLLSLENTTTQPLSTKDNNDPLIIGEEDFDPLRLTNNTESNDGDDDLVLHPSLFQQETITTNDQPLLPQPIIPLASSSHQSYPSLQPQSSLVQPRPLLQPHPSLQPRPHNIPNRIGMQQQRSVGGVSSKGQKDVKKSDWMNVFAHLDPIANEKA